METLARHNSPLIMSQCGSKGSAINIAQVVRGLGGLHLGSGSIHDRRVVLVGVARG